jgi:hypothetical protein
VNSGLFLTEKFKYDSNNRTNLPKVYSIRERKKQINQINVEFIQMLARRKKEEKSFVKIEKSKNNSLISSKREIRKRASSPKGTLNRKTSLDAISKISSINSNRIKLSKISSSVSTIKLEEFRNNLRMRENKNVKKVVPSFHSSNLEKELISELQSLGFNSEKKIEKENQKNPARAKLNKVYKIDPNTERSLNEVL